MIRITARTRIIPTVTIIRTVTMHSSRIVLITGKVLMGIFVTPRLSISRCCMVMAGLVPSIRRIFITVIVTIRQNPQVVFIGTAITVSNIVITGIKELI